MITFILNFLQLSISDNFVGYLTQPDSEYSKVKMPSIPDLPRREVRRLRHAMSHTTNNKPLRPGWPGSRTGLARIVPKFRSKDRAGCEGSTLINLSPPGSQLYRCIGRKCSSNSTLISRG